MYKGERFNSITHLIGAVLSIAGLVVLVVFAADQGDPWKIISASIFGVTLVLLYSFSTLYHSIRGKNKAIFRKLDHHAIFFLIAGSYTPFTLVTLRGTWGWSLFGIIWGLAIIGMIVESLPVKGRRILPVIFYILMGWTCLIAIKPILDSLPIAGFYWLLAGGLFYTVGIIFYAFDSHVRHFHGIWHLFVLAGSLSHYIAILYYVIL